MRQGPAAHLRPFFREEQPMGVATLRVLVVDNRSDCEDIASLFIRRWGNDVLTVFGDLFPMDEAREFAPELVMVHADRSEFDALSLVKRFRRRQGFGSVPLIAMSSKRDPESRSAGIAAGFDRWLVKPIPFSELSGLLSDVRAVISMPEGLAQQTMDQVERFDVLKLEHDLKRRNERLGGP
jgi:DNA-binding response OmpR family regulator